MAEHPQKTDQYGNWEAKEIEDEHEDQESSNTSEWMTDVAKPAATLYALLLIISNVALALSTQARRDNHIPVLYTECFDAAIYIVSIIYLGYALLILFNEPRAFEKQASSVCAQLLSCGSRGRNRSLAPESSSLGAYGTSNTASVTDGERPGVSHHAERKSSRGSVYLKMNAILCGVGAMIYSCLEFGVYLNNRKCYEIISGVIPLLLSIYISIQTYFIFLHSKKIIRKHIILNRFGLMHLVATDITMWLRVLIDQTLYEFSVYRSENNNEDGAAPTNSTGDTARSVFLGRTAFRAPSSGITLHGQKVSTDGQATSVGDLDLSPLCAQSDSVLGDVLVNASVFLYPCIIGYAVISAGIVYCVCRNIRSEASLGHTTSGSRHASERRPSEVSLQNCANCQTTSYDHPDSSHRLYWLDCDQAVGGLLGGSVVLAMTIVCLILFFIFKTRNPEQAVLEAQIGESILYTLGIIAVVAAFGQAIRHLPKIPSTSVNWELDTEMLLTSMMGVYAFPILCIIGTNDEDPATPTNTILIIVSSCMSIFQSTLQTIYIFEASHRSIPRNSIHSGQKVPKPGRNALTFLCCWNISMWSMNIFKTLRSEANPIQRQFFGFYEWTIITHVTVPLQILYRFHSAASLFEIWKHAYKVDNNMCHCGHGLTFDPHGDARHGVKRTGALDHRDM